MGKIIKINLELDNNGDTYNSGTVISKSTQYVETITEQTAKTMLLAGKDVYFVYQHDKDIKTPWVKLCKDIDYLVDHYHYGDTCGIILNKHMLSDEEYELVNKLAGLSGMACWFMLCSTGDEYYVRDVEDCKDLSLSKGLKLLSEGLVSLDDYLCTNDEKAVFKVLCERLNINYTV